MRRNINIGPYILFIIILLLWQCKGKEEDDIRMITFQGSEIHREFSSWHFSALDSLSYGNLIIRNGEWVFVNDFYFSNSRVLPDTLRFQKSDDALTYINGDLACISIFKDSLIPPFYNQLSAEDISHLRTINLETPIWDSNRPFIEKIAQLNPSIDILYYTLNDTILPENEDLLWLSKHFQPKSLLLVIVPDSTTYSTLVNFPSLESLKIGLPLNGEVNFPYLPKLKQMILFDVYNDSSSISPEFFKEVPNLESLTIDVNSSRMDWTSINSLKNLRHLYINSDSIIPDDIYGFHPKLKFLELETKRLGVSISGILKKNKLKWLSISTMDSLLLGQKSKVLQDSFPELEYLEFKNNDSLLDYRNFKNIKKLKYLVVNGKVGLDTTLHHLDHLDYISLPYKFLKDSVNMVKVKKALPNTVIAPNSGACLGSGWLLLLIPLAGLWFYVLKPTKRIRGND